MNVSRPRNELIWKVVPGRAGLRGPARRLKLRPAISFMSERGHETILVVDDEVAVCSLARLMLTRHGYSVIDAGSGAEALHLFEVWPDLEVDLALIDIVMPLMSGVKLAEKLRAVRPNLPVLYTSAYP